jgi:hypothetical protein
MVWEDKLSWFSKPLDRTDGMTGYNVLLSNPLDRLGGVVGCTVMIHQPSGQTWWCEDALS